MPPQFNSAIRNVDSVMKQTDKTIDPLRRSIFRRFPTFFTLVVTFGIGATFFGIERILAMTPLFNEHPWYTMIAGVITLAITGKLYAKLG